MRIVTLSGLPDRSRLRAAGESLTPTFTTPAWRMLFDALPTCRVSRPIFACADSRTVPAPLTVTRTGSTPERAAFRRAAADKPATESV